MISRAIPMREAFGDIRDVGSFGYRMREFLDRFREAPSFDLISEEPALLVAVLGDGGRADAFLASTAAYLAQEKQFMVPVWARDCARALEVPWFAAKTHNLRMILLQESPAAFRVRNLFVSANALSRA